MLKLESCSDQKYRLLWVQGLVTSWTVLAAGVGPVSVAVVAAVVVAVLVAAVVAAVVLAAVVVVAVLVAVVMVALVWWQGRLEDGM